MERTETLPRIAFERAGDVGPKVLLVMGLGMRGLVWKPTTDRLREDHQLVFFDNRGIGESDPMSGVARIADFARDSLRVADAAGFDRFHLVGVSLGGMISQEIALRAPDRLRSLTLIATHAGGPTGLMPHSTGLYHFARALTSSSAEQRTESLLRLLYTESFLSSVDRDALSERVSVQTRERAAPRSTAGQLLAVMMHNTRSRLRSIKTPTLVIKPESDVLVRPSHSDVLARGIAGSTLLSLSDAGHGTIYQNADAVAGALREHIARNER